MRWADRRGNGSKVSERTTAYSYTHRGVPLLAKSCTVSSAERALSERGKRERRRSGIAQCDRERAGRSHSCARGVSAARFFRKVREKQRGCVAFAWGEQQVQNECAMTWTREKNRFKIECALTWTREE